MYAIKDTNNHIMKERTYSTSSDELSVASNQSITEEDTSTSTATTEKDDLIATSSHHQTKNVIINNNNKIKKNDDLCSTLHRDNTSTAAIAEYFPSTTILFADIVGFTAWARYVLCWMMFVFGMWHEISLTHLAYFLQYS